MAEETLDPGLLEQTKNQIRKLVAEIHELAESEVQPAEFHVEFLNRVVAAVAANGGALWLLDGRGGLKLQYQLEFRQTGLMDNRQAAAPHDALLTCMLQAAHAEIIPPGASVEGVPNAGNPTRLALIIAPIVVDKQIVGLVEVLMDPNRRAAQQKSTLRFVSDLCDLAGGYLKNRQVRQMMSQQKLWNQLESFAHSIHHSLDLRETAYAVANDGKRLVGCDRLSVALKIGGRMLVEAVSGQEVVEQRSNLIRELTQLCKVVAQSGEDLVYTGNTEGYPPDIRDALEIYVDESGSKALVVTLLHRPESEDDKDKHDTPIYGCLVAEQIGDEMAPTDMQARTEVVGRHASTALWNAQEHDKIFLLPLLKAMGSPWRFFRGRTLAKILAVLALIVGVILAMTFVPWQLTIEGRGSILPENRRTTYAPFRGRVVELPHEHGDFVRKGELLVKLESLELEGELKKLEAEKNDALSKMANVRNRLVKSIRPDEKTQLEGEMAEAQIRREGAEKQIEILQEQIQQLSVTAPQDGIVTTWEVKKTLQGRPVDVGQELIKIAAVDGEWVLEVNVPDSDMAPVRDAKARLDRLTAPIKDAYGALGAALRNGADAAATTKAVEGFEQALKEAELKRPGDLVDLAPLRAAAEKARALATGGGSDPQARAEVRERLEAALERAGELSAYFVSATDPQNKYPGFVRRIASKAETVEGKHLVKVTVSFSEDVKEQFLRNNRLLRPGAEVRARLRCGDARLAYVLLRDVVHFWHESVMFRWPFLR